MQDKAVAKYKALRLLGLKHSEAIEQILMEYPSKDRKELQHVLIGELIHFILK